MEKPKPGTRIVQDAGEILEYVVVPDEESDHPIEDDRFAVKPLNPAPGEGIGTFPVEVLDQDNFVVKEV